MYSGFPIYYGTKLDYRTRMYPWEYLLSITTGELKQLLCDFKSKKLTIEGLKNLMTAYYRFFIKGSVKWYTFLTKKNITKKSDIQLLKSFFKEFNIINNINEFNCKDKICYILLLHNNLLNIFDENKPDLNVNLLLEIDQVCFGMMF